MRVRTLLMVSALLLAACGSGHDAQRTVVELGSSAQGCDAALQPCRVSHNQGEMTLELEHNLRTLQPFQLQLQLGGAQQADIEEVVVEFFMEGMEMGVNRYRLLRSESGWAGTITLPVCVAGRSDWRAVVEARRAETVYRALFRFHSSG